MKYSSNTMITRWTYEKAAIAAGVSPKRAMRMRFSELAAIVSERERLQKELYRQAQLKENAVPHSHVLADNPGAAVDALVCDECGGEGKVEVILGNSPYDAVIDCEACDGTGEVDFEEAFYRRAA